MCGQEVVSMHLYRDVREELTIDTDQLSRVSKAVYIMGEKEDSATQLLQEYGFSRDEAALIYDTARPVQSNGPERVFQRLLPFADEDVSYTDPDMF